MEDRNSQDWQQPKRPVMTLFQKEPTRVERAMQLMKDTVKLTLLSVLAFATLTLSWVAVRGIWRLTCRLLAAF